MKLCPPSARTICVSLYFVLAGLLSTHAFADTKASPIGLVIWVKGRVTASQPNSKPRLLKRRSPLFEHDLISTTANGTGEIAFADSSVVVLQANTDLHIDKYNYKPGALAEHRSVLSLLKGGFRTITGRIPKENVDKYSVNTPVATIGVRGTDYSTFYSPQKGLSLRIDFGQIVVSTLKGNIILDKNRNQLYATVPINQVPHIDTKPVAALSEQVAITSVPAKPIDMLPVVAPPIPSATSPTESVTVSPPNDNGSIVIPAAPKNEKSFCIG